MTRPSIHAAQWDSSLSVCPHLLSFLLSRVMHDERRKRARKIRRNYFCVRCGLKRCWILVLMSGNHKKRPAPTASGDPESPEASLTSTPSKRAKRYYIHLNITFAVLCLPMACSIAGSEPDPNSCLSYFTRRVKSLHLQVTKYSLCVTVVC